MDRGDCGLWITNTEGTVACREGRKRKGKGKEEKASKGWLGVIMFGGWFLQNPSPG